MQVTAAEEMLKDYYELLPELYGMKSCTLNAHSLTHLAAYVRLWGPLWTHSAFGFESMNGHLTSMIHSKYRIADQVLFAIDVSNTLGMLSDELEEVESSETLTFINPCRLAHSRVDMSPLFPGTYSVGSLRTATLSGEEFRAFNCASRHPQVTVFHRLYRNNCMFYSSQYGREDGKRNSSVCCYVAGGVEDFGIIQKFCLASGYPPVAIIKPFKKTGSTLLKSIGDPGRELLTNYAEIDLLSTFFVQVMSRSYLPLCAIPVCDILCKCIIISHTCSTTDYIIKLPNNFERH